MRRSTSIGTLLFLAGWAAAWAQGGSEPSFACEDRVVAIGATDGVGDIAIPVSPGKEPPSLIDAGVPKPPAVTFKAGPAAKGRNGEALQRYAVEVKGLPANTTQKRSATVTTGTSSTTLVYWLTNRIPALVIPKVDHWVIPDNHPWDQAKRCKRIMAYSGDFPGTDGQLLQANVERETGRESIDLHRLHICRKGPCDGTDSVDLEAHRATPLQLCLDDGFLWPGKYSGTVWLGTTQKPDGQSFDLSFYVRDRFLRFLGLVLIVTGVGGSWWLKVRSKPQLNRLQALAPAAYLQQQLAKLGLRLDKLPEYINSLPHTQQQIKTYESDLSEEALDGKNRLPPKPPAPINAPQIDAAGYNQLIATASSLLDVLAVVVGGVEDVRKLDSTIPPAAPAPPVVTALTDLDKIGAAVPLPSRDAAQAQVGDILATLKTALAALQRRLQGKMAMMAVVPAAATPTYQSYDQIQVKIRQLNAEFWWAWAVLTVLTGFAFLILNNPFFGTPLDLVSALAWGFGIPTVLQAVASSSVASALGISVPQI